MPQVTLDDELARYIEQQVASGRFRSASDVVRAGLELLDEAAVAHRREEIRAELAARTAGSARWLTAEDVFADLRTTGSSGI